MTFNVTAGPGTASGVDTLTMDLQQLNPATGNWGTVSIAGGTSPVTIDGTTTLNYTQRIWWGRPVAQSNNAGAQFQYGTIQALLGPQLRVRVTHGGTAGTGSWTYSVSVILTAS